MRTSTIASLCLAVTLVATEAHARGGAPRPSPLAEPSADVQFADALRIINLADTAVQDGRYDQALELYRDAYHAHSLLSSQFPEWKPDVVRSRTEHCADRMNALRDVIDSAPDAETKPAAQTAAPPPAASATPPSRNAVDAEMTAPRDLAKDEFERSKDSSRPIQQELQKPPQSLAALTASAKQKIAAGDFDEARSLLLQALRANPDDTTIRLLLGLVQCRVERFSDATSLLRPLTEETPEDPLAHLYLAGALTGLGQLDDAISELRLAIRYEPRLHQAHFNLAQLLLKLAPPDVATAKKHYDMSIKHGGTSDPALEKRFSVAPAP